jgi:hypothetical protein
MFNKIVHNVYRKQQLSGFSPYRYRSIFANKNKNGRQDVDGNMTDWRPL